MWSKPLLCRFQQPGEILQTQVLQGFAAFRLALFRIPPRHTQIKRATNCAIPGYLILNHYLTKFVRLKDFLSVVIYVVKAAFVPLSATGGKPAIARAARLCGLLSKPRMDRVYALPNQVRYQLRYTRIKIRRPLPGGVSTIPAFSSACKGKICPAVFYIPEAFSPCRITAPAPPSARPPDRSFPKPRPGPPGPYGRRPPAYGRWAFADPDRG